MHIVYKHQVRLFIYSQRNQVQSCNGYGPVLFNSNSSIVQVVYPPAVQAGSHQPSPAHPSPALFTYSEFAPLIQVGSAKCSGGVRIIEAFLSRAMGYVSRLI
jgi:hypothetical protein